MTYRAEVVGSLLRPTYLAEAREQLAAGKLNAAEFKAIEDRAVNEAIARSRKLRRSAEVIVLDSHPDSEAPAAETTMSDNPENQPERQAVRAETRRLIEAKIDALPDAFRTVFVLRAVEEMSVEEVAESLSIPVATVRTRFFRAKT